MNLTTCGDFVTIRVEINGFVGMANPVWSQHTILGDIDGDGAVGISDLLELLANWE